MSLEVLCEKPDRRRIKGVRFAFLSKTSAVLGTGITTRWEGEVLGKLAWEVYRNETKVS